MIPRLGDLHHSYESETPSSASPRIESQVHLARWHFGETQDSLLNYFALRFPECFYSDKGVEERCKRPESQSKQLYRVELAATAIATASIAMPNVKTAIERREAFFHSPERTPTALAVRTMVI